MDGWSFISTIVVVILEQIVSICDFVGQLNSIVSNCDFVSDELVIVLDGEASVDKFAVEEHLEGDFGVK